MATAIFTAALSAVTSCGDWHWGDGIGALRISRRVAEPGRAAMNRFTVYRDISSTYVLFAERVAATLNNDVGGRS